MTGFWRGRSVVAQVCVLADGPGGCGPAWVVSFFWFFVLVCFWFSLASAVCSFAGIRVMHLVCKRCPCAGRHLLFFAAAKKSRQKKAANTANPCSCLRAPTGSYASNGNHATHVRCQRSRSAPHPLHVPASRHALSGSPPPPRWQTVCRPQYLTRLTPDR